MLIVIVSISCNNNNIFNYAYMIYNYNLPNIGDERPLYDSFMNGGLLGMMTYAIFDLTNYAIFNKWALKEAIIDILWGSFYLYCWIYYYINLILKFKLFLYNILFK